MSERDPYDPEPPYTYECLECGNRIEADSRPESCPNCGGTMRDISVPRE
jgi:rubrerythrin